jgi:beta-lactamase class A
MLRTALLLLLPAALWSQPAVSDLLEAKTLDRLRRYDAAFDGVLGVAAIDLEAGHSFAWNGDTVFPQASVIKIPILVRLYEVERAGGFRFSDKVVLKPAEAVPGSGRLQFELKNGPVSLTIRDLAAAMIVDSDNTATNKCNDLAGGFAAVNAMLDRHGFRATRLRRKMMDAAAAERGDENVSTPNEMSRLVEQVYRTRVVDAEASRGILDLMKRVSGGMHEGLPLDTETAVKTGELPGSRSETGIIFLPHRPFVLSVMSAYIDDRHPPVADVTRTVYALFEKLARSNRYGRTIR